MLQSGGDANATGVHSKRFGAWAIQALVFDLRYAARILRKNPGFTLAVLLTVALGIGANTAIFGATYAILLKPLPYSQPSELVQIMANRTLPVPVQTSYVSTAEFDDVSSETGLFEQIAEYRPASITLVGPGNPETLAGMQVSGDFFSLYGVRPILGRPILPADAQPGHTSLALLSYSLWREHFGADPAICGKVIALVVQPATFILNSAVRAETYTIIGVMPPHARFPLAGDLWVPMLSTIGGPQTDPMGHSLRAQHSVSAVARLKRNVTLSQVNGKLHVIAARLASEYPASDKGWDLGAVLLRDEIVGQYRVGLLLLLSAASFLLLLACVSASNLLIARSWVRRTEVAIREALGATRWRLVRQFLLESMVLAIAAGALSLLFASWSANLLRTLAPPETPRLDEVGLDWHVLVYALTMSLVAGFFFGLLPALHVTKPEISGLLKDGASATLATTSGRPYRIRNFLVVTEIALALLLIVGSTLALRSFEKLVRVNLGYKVDHILTMYVKFSVSACAKSEQCQVTLQQLLDRVRALPGVESAAAAGTKPLDPAFTIGDLQIEGEPRSETNAGAEFGMITPGYFKTMGIPLLTGRTFSDTDNEKSMAVAVVNEAMAHRYFSGRSSGKHFGLGKHNAPNWIEVVGEVRDVRDMNPSRKPLPEFYLPLSQANLVPKICLLIRTSSDPTNIANTVRHTIWSVDADAPISELETMNQAMSRKVVDPRFRTILLSAFGGLGLLLAFVGVYGVISYAISQRTREIGIRMALGATPRDVLRLVLSEGMMLGASGIVIGIGAAIVLTRFMQSMLFEVTTTDPLTFIGSALIIIVVTLVACYVPARRAMRVDPVIALRHG